MCSVDSIAVRRIAYAITTNTNIQSLGNPVLRDTLGESTRETVDVAGCGSAVVVDVAGEAAFVVGVADEEDAFYGGEGCAGELGEGVDCCGGTLRVSFQDEAFICVGPQCGCDFVDDVAGTSSRVLAETCRIDGVVDFATGDCTLDVGVHCTKACAWALSFSSAPGVDDCVATASSLSLDHCCAGRASQCEQGAEVECNHFD